MKIDEHIFCLLHMLVYFKKMLFSYRIINLVKFRTVKDFATRKDRLESMRTLGGISNEDCLTH